MRQTLPLLEFEKFSSIILTLLNLYNIYIIQEEQFLSKFSLAPQCINITHLVHKNATSNHYVQSLKVFFLSTFFSNFCLKLMNQHSNSNDHILTSNTRGQKPIYFIIHSLFVFPFLEHYELRMKCFFKSCVFLKVPLSNIQAPTSTPNTKRSI